MIVTCPLATAVAKPVVGLMVAMEGLRLDQVIMGDGIRFPSTYHASAMNVCVPPKPEMDAPAGVTRYVASRRGKMVHLASCTYARRINERNRLAYNTLEAALAGGRKPCPTCMGRGAHRQTTHAPRAVAPAKPSSRASPK